MRPPIPAALARCVLATACGGAGTTEQAAKTPVLPTVCDEAISTFHKYDVAETRAVNAGSDARRAMRNLFVAAVDTNVQAKVTAGDAATRAKVARLVTAYSKTTSMLVTRVLLARVAETAYTTDRAKCKIRTVPVLACRTTLTVAARMIALDRSKANPVLTGTSRVSTTLASIVKSDNPTYGQLKYVIDTINALSTRNSAYVKLDKPLVASYNRVLNSCYRQVVVEPEH